MALTLNSLPSAVPHFCLAGMSQLEATVCKAPTVPGCCVLGFLLFKGQVAPSLWLDNA